ncbi:hypothetical protein BCR42DRAFT_425813 [Absidia repens]|uniref:Uncharacterized protein n=1 Tax=Absidia repens TaxID=90262 RepID=A0A1X2I255_9FUNG|nr:hypothetical protein BCR42DRAFT_425813 [Absidia repens]
MVKSSTIIIALAAFAGHNVLAQDINPTSALAGLDPGSLSSALAQAESSLAAMQTNPTYSSLIANNPTFSSAMAEASSYMANPSSAAAAAASSAGAAHNSGSSVQPIGAAALVISAAVAVGML